MYSRESIRDERGSEKERAQGDLKGLLERKEQRNRVISLGSQGSTYSRTDCSPMPGFFLHSLRGRGGFWACPRFFDPLDFPVACPIRNEVFGIRGCSSRDLQV